MIPWTVHGRPAQNCHFIRHFWTDGLLSPSRNFIHPLLFLWQPRGFFSAAVPTCCHCVLLRELSLFDRAFDRPSADRLIVVSASSILYCDPLLYLAFRFFDQRLFWCIWKGRSLSIALEEAAAWFAVLGLWIAEVLNVAVFRSLSSMF